MAHEAPKPEVKKQITTIDRLRVKAIMKLFEFAMKNTYGEDGKELLLDSIAGICVDGMIGQRVCYPDDEAGGQLMVHRADNAAYISYDPRRPTQFPVGEKHGNPSMVKEGALVAFMVDGLEHKQPDDLTLLMPHDWISPEILYSVDKPGLERLIELGMLARRSHELAFEHAGMEQYIDDLRARSMHDEIVYQVTPKGNTLVTLEPDGGKRTRQPDAKPAPFKVPGLIPQAT